MTDDGVTLTDHFDYTGQAPITERFVSLIEPKVNGNTVTINSASVTTADGIIASVSSTVGSKDQTVWFIDYTLAPDTKEFTLTVK